MKLKAWISEERGRAGRLAEAILLASPENPVLIYQWANGVREVPFERCTAIERATDGAVRRWDLRPDDWHLHWPELINAKGAPKVPEQAAAG